jgi:hypothetical protein
LAADQAMRKGELHGILLALDKAPYKQQAPKLLESLNTAFKPRLAKDADLDDLPEILEALHSAEENSDDDGGEDAAYCAGKDEDGSEGMVSDLEEEPGKQLMAILAKCNLPEEVLGQVNELLNKIAAPKPAGDAFPPKNPGEKADGKNGPEPPDKAPAMDAATLTKIVTQATTADLKARYRAGEKVKPFIGAIDVLAADSAPAIYKMALDAKGVATKGIPPEAFEAMVGMLPTTEEVSRPARLAADAAGAQTLAKKYPNAPALM